ncbi:MFS transporter [Rhizobium yanglingense]
MGQVGPDVCFGRFALTSLGLYAALAIDQLLVSDRGTVLLLRAASGFIPVALIPLCLFHMMQAFPERWRLRGLVLGIGVTQCAVPLARLLSPLLLASQGWRSLFLFEAGLALLSFAAVELLRLPQAERDRVFLAARPAYLRADGRWAGVGRGDAGTRPLGRMAPGAVDNYFAHRRHRSLADSWRD